MRELKANGKTFILDDEGFLADPERWDHDVAREIAKQLEIPNLTDEQLDIVDFHLDPLVSPVCQGSFDDLREKMFGRSVDEIFPDPHFHQFSELVLVSSGGKHYDLRSHGPDLKFSDGLGVESALEFIPEQGDTYVVILEHLQSLLGGRCILQPDPLFRQGGRKGLHKRSVVVYEQNGRIAGWCRHAEGSRANGVVRSYRKGSHLSLFSGVWQTSCLRSVPGRTPAERLPRQPVIAARAESKGFRNEKV